MERRAMPGMDGMTSRFCSPSQMKRGWMRSSTVRVCSRVRRRLKSSLRLRRLRVSG